MSAYAALLAAKQAYEARLLSAPLLTKAITSFILATMSNIVGQLPGGQIHMGSAMKYGLLDAPPHSHFWCDPVNVPLTSCQSNSVVESKCAHSTVTHVLEIYAQY